MPELLPELLSAVPAALDARDPKDGRVRRAAI